MTDDWRGGVKMQGLDERQIFFLWNEVPELKGHNTLRKI